MTLGNGEITLCDTERAAGDHEVGGEGAAGPLVMLDSTSYTEYANR